MQQRNSQPTAAACIHGGEGYPGIFGKATLTPCKKGTLITVRLRGLPNTETDFFALHIHEGADCRGQGFPNTGGHYDSRGREHPVHAGDLPPLLSCGGEAYLSVLTERFCVSEVIGRTLVVHSQPDDFRTQPSGNAGTRIACGVIHQT